MRRLFAVLIGLVILPAPGGAQPRRSGEPRPTRTVEVPQDRLPRLERWLKAVDRHEPGDDDDEAAEVGSWSIEQLRGIWIDASTLLQLMRNLNLSRFSVKGEGQANPVEVRYSSQQVRRLVVLACAAAGLLSGDQCVHVKAVTSLDEALVDLGKHAAAERLQTGEDNYVLRRAALLHSDIGTLRPVGEMQPFAASGAATVGPQAFRVETSDGRSLDFGLTALHWDIARLVLDHVKPSGTDRPAPQRDPMVRAWYRATAAWMQFREEHDTLHLDRGRRIFPDDADLLFLSGCQHEIYASPMIQAAVRTVVLPTGLAIGIESDRNELRQSETFFRRALAQRSDMVEARLRFGRVLGRLGRHAEAAAELQQAIPLLDDDDLRYYGELFLAAEETALGHFDIARAGYQRASALFPLAQSPYIGLSELAHRRGDRAAAAAAMQKVFELPAAIDRERDDPWWRYNTVQARLANEWLDDVRRPFQRRRVNEP